MKLLLIIRMELLYSMPMKRKHYQRGLFAFIAISTITAIIIMFTTADNTTWTLLKNMKPVTLLLLAGIAALEFTSDSLSLKLLGRAAGESIPLGRAYELSSVKFFFNVVSPFSFGGQPAIIYAMKRDGIPVGKATSITMAKLLFFSLWGAAAALFAFGVLADQIRDSIIFFLILIIASLNIAVIILGFYSFFHPKLLFLILNGLDFLIRLLRLQPHFPNFRRESAHEAWFSRRIFRHYLFGGDWHARLGIVFAFLQELFLSLLMFFILRGFGVEMLTLQGISRSILLFFLMWFMPTPGGAGIGEGIFFVLFAGIAPLNVLGIAVILWRFFFQYFKAVIGGFLTFRHFRSLWQKEMELPADPKAGKHT